MSFPKPAFAYKIYWEGNEVDSYVGGTYDLEKRMREHRCKFKNDEKGKNFKYECLGQRLVNSDEEKFQFEEMWRIQLKPNLSSKRAYLSPEIRQKDKTEWRKGYRERNRKVHNERARLYYAENKEAIRKQKNKFREENKEAIIIKKKIKMTCECGSVVRKDDMARHKRTKKHQDYLQNV